MQPLLQWESDEEDDDLLQLVSKTKGLEKKAVLYVGRLRSNMIDEAMLKLVEQRAIKQMKNQGVKFYDSPPEVYNHTVFGELTQKMVCSPGPGLSPESAWCSGRLAIDVGSADLLCGFWPGRAYARPWNFERYATRDAGKDHSGP